MNTVIIDRMIVIVQNSCDKIGYDIDSNTEYVALCQLVTDVQVNEKIPTFEEKKWASEVLEMFFDALGLNYGRTLFQLVDEFYGVK
jgi:hypothetical protein